MPRPARTLTPRASLGKRNEPTLAALAAVRERVCSLYRQSKQKALATRYLRGPSVLPALGYRSATAWRISAVAAGDCCRDSASNALSYSDNRISTVRFQTFVWHQRSYPRRYRCSRLVMRAVSASVRHLPRGRSFGTRNAMRTFVHRGVSAMETREVVQDEIAELKALIARQQELIHKLQRAGRKEQARRERDLLYASLNRLDVLQAARERDTNE